MPVGCITAARYCSTTLVDRSKCAHPIQHAVKFIHVSRNAVAIGIEPGARSDSVPSVHGIVALGAEIGVPSEVTPVDAFRQVRLPQVPLGLRHCRNLRWSEKRTVAP